MKNHWQTSGVFAILLSLGCIRLFSSRPDQWWLAVLAIGGLGYTYWVVRKVGWVG